MKFSARLFIFIFLFLLVFCSPKIILADTTNTTTDTPQPWESFQPTLESVEAEELNARQQEVANPNQTSLFASRTTNLQLGDSLVSGVHMMGGWVSPQAKASGYLSEQEKRGAIGDLALAMGTIYSNPPASGLAWVHDTLANAGLIAKPAYAQGIGFVGLAPLLPLWTMTRNISYTILVIVMVAIGFMIIFRTKIDPKTVISVQAALPKIILTIILITFSYPIVGFMIDLMYLAMAILINILATSAAGLQLPPGTESMANAAQQQAEFITGGWWKLIISVFNLNMLIPFMQQFFSGLTLNIPNIGIFGIASTIGAIIAGVIIPSLTAGPALLIGIGAVSLIIVFIIFLGLLFTLIRLTFLLLNSYIQILLALILGPLLLLKEAIPGQSAFSEWIQNLIANLIVFPATVAVIYFSWILTALAWKSNLWGAPLIPVGGGGEVGGQGNPLALLMGLGTIFLAPNLVASVKKVFHPKPALPITAGSAFAPVTGGAQTAMGAMSQYYYMSQVFGSGHGPLGPLLSKLGIGGGSGGGGTKTTTTP